MAATNALRQAAGAKGKRRRVARRKPVVVRIAVRVSPQALEAIDYVWRHAGFRSREAYVRWRLLDDGQATTSGKSRASLEALASTVRDIIQLVQSRPAEAQDELAVLLAQIEQLTAKADG